MQCCDFERIWNEQLDGRDAVSPEVQRTLERHAASCASCGGIAAGYQVLSRVVRALDPPAAPADFLSRFLESQELAAPPVPWIVRIRRAVMPVAAAASLFLIVLIGGRGRPAPPGRPQAKSAGPRIPSIDAQALTDALAYAGSATLDLARETSAPAARIGREVLDASSLVESTERLPLPVNVAPPGDVLQSVGDRVNAGVRPFSGAARHAFGFLLGSPSASHHAKPAPAASEGA